MLIFKLVVMKEKECREKICRGKKLEKIPQFYEFYSKLGIYSFQKGPMEVHFFFGNAVYCMLLCDTTVFTTYHADFSWDTIPSIGTFKFGLTLIEMVEAD